MANGEKTETALSGLERFFNKRGAALALAAAFLYAALFIAIDVMRYATFDFDDFDLAIDAQTLFNIIHGSLASSILGVPFLANHTRFILFLIAPIYFVIRTPLALLILQTLAISLGALLLYRISAAVLGSQLLSFVISVIFLAYPPLSYAHLYEFHPTTLTIPMVFLMYMAYMKNDFRRYLWLMFLILLAQENMPLLAMMMGLYAYVDRKKADKWVLYPAALGIVSFILFVFIVKPFFNKGIMNYMLLYEQFGKTPAEVAANAMNRPELIATSLINPPNMNYLFTLLWPLCFIPLLSLKTLIPTAPFILQHLLSYRLEEKEIIFHYCVDFIPFLFISMVYGVRKLFAHEQMDKARKFFMGLFICLSLWIIASANITLGPHLVSKIKNLRYDSSCRAVDGFLRRIPGDAAVAATFEFLPKLSNREHLYSFHHIYKGKYTMSERDYATPENIRYAMINFNDRITFSWRSKERDKNLQRFLGAGDWKVADYIDSFVLFSKDGGGEMTALFNADVKEAVYGGAINAAANDDVELLGFTGAFGKEKDAGRLFLKFYWKCLKKTDADYLVMLFLVDSKRNLVKHVDIPMCYRMAPSYDWKEGQVVELNVTLMLPENVKSEDHYIKLAIGDYNRRRTCPFVAKGPASVVDPRDGAIWLLKMSGETKR